VPNSAQRAFMPVSGGREGAMACGPARCPSLTGSGGDPSASYDGVERVEHVTAWIYREGDGYVALCPELDIASQGDSIEEARHNIKEAVALFFETASDGEIRQRFQREFYVTPLDVKVG